jgi:predicted ATPase
MRELPRGTVTFLFTDIEGSTRLLHELGERYAEALADHRRLLREAFAAHGGVEIDTQGDAFFYAFPDAGEAVAAAAAGRDALTVGPILVRTGLHTGTPELTGDGYVGLDVHLGARVAAAGHGGQVLLSEATRELVDAEVLDLGEHRLKDFAEPVAIFQLGAETFPPLNTISNTNLPRPVSAFVGRERERAEVVALVRESRLVTLTGAGGSGKTRLAIEAAGELVPESKGGVFWVGLATLRDASLVLDTIAQTLGAKDGLAEHVGERELLLLIDNFEQVVEAAPELAALVESCPNLRVLVTSRELLRVRGEVEYAVLPLAESDAAELFCTRARVEREEAVEELCRRLDNLPLAIELAAARANVLSPRQLVERLGDRLDLLRGGRDAESRQQTLRATIAWSHDLLDAEEQRAFARLAVFAGGCTIAAAESVCGVALDTVQSLVDKSLVRWTDERFWMLETIREYAAERFQAMDDASDVAERHAQFYLTLVEEPERQLIQGEASERWIERATADYDNLRVALSWADESGRSELVSRFAVALWAIWSLRGSVTEARRWIEAAMGSCEALDRATRARVVDIAGSVALAQGENERAHEYFLEALSAYGELGDTRHAARMLLLLSHVEIDRKQIEEATRLLDESAGLYRGIGHVGGLATVTNSLAILAHQQRDYDRAAALYARSLELFEAVSEVSAFTPLLNLSDVSLDRGDIRGAAVRAREALGNAVKTDHPGHIAYAVGLCGRIAAAQGSAEAAAQLLAASEALLNETGEARQVGEREAHERARRHAASQLTEEGFAEAWRAGSQLTPEAAIGHARRVLD